MASLMLLDVDPIALWGLIVAIVGVAVSIVAAIAAIYAAVYAKAAPTKDDLAKVEQNTAHLEDVRATITDMNARSKRQTDRDELISKASRVSVTVRGEDFEGNPFNVRLTLKDPSIGSVRNFV